MSLLRTAARASVATRVIGNTHRRQQQRWAAQDAASSSAPPPAPVTPAPATPAPPAPASSARVTSELIDQLTRLGELRDAGILTDAEFDVQKQRLLAA